MAFFYVKRTVFIIKQVQKVRKAKTVIPKTLEEKEEIKIQSFLDMAAPSVIKFYNYYYVCGNSFKSVWAIRDYPTETSEQAILRHLGEMSGVTLKIYSSHMSSYEERKIINNATNKNSMNLNNSNNMSESVQAKMNLDDVADLIAEMHRNKEPLLKASVYIETSALTLDDLKDLQANVMAELTRGKLSVDRLLLRQKEGFTTVQPCGYNMFKEQFERVLPAKSVANFYPFSYSGKTDSKGIYIGEDKYGSNIIVDFNKRGEDKVNSNILILGNSGQGKSYLLKLIITNLLETGKCALLLDAEDEYFEIVQNLGGVYIDLTSGKYKINVLEPKMFYTKIDEALAEKDEDLEAEKALKEMEVNVISNHISFLRDFFRSYKNFADEEIDVIEIMLKKLYDKFNMYNNTDFSKFESASFPILSDFYELLEEEYNRLDEHNKYQEIYTKDMLQKILLGLNSMCVGSESQIFNGYTNVKDDRFVCFGVKALLNANQNLRNALMFNLLSYMSDKLLTKGNTFASVDELYLFLSNLTIVEYLRNFMKRVRKKESLVILATQNVEDFNLPKVKEYTKPLFAIPTYKFIFNCGETDPKVIMDLLQINESEFGLIKHPQRGQCLFKAGIETFHLQVKAPKHKAELFGSGGGR